MHGTLWTFSSFKPALLRHRGGILMLYIYAGAVRASEIILIILSLLVFAIITSVKYGDDLFSW